MLKLVRKAVMTLYSFLNSRRLLVRPEVKADLERLRPGLGQEELCRDYYVKKIEKSLMVILAGSALAILLAVRAAGERELEQGNALRRGAVTDEAREVTVEAVVSGERDRFQIPLEPRRLKEEEIETYYRDFSESLPRLIAGDNPSIWEVSQNLNLWESYEGYPFSVEWKSQDVDCVTSAGVVSPKEREKEVTLKALIVYGEREWTRDLTVRVMPEILTAKEERHRRLEGRLLDGEERTREEEYWILPGDLDGEVLTWRLVAEDNSLLLWVGSLAVSVMIYVMSDRDLHEKLERQREEMKRRYPDIVHKLALYLGAGMTLQGAFRKMSAEYERKKANSSRADPIYEEMLYTCRELDSGVPEESAYEHFGRRTGVQEYIRLGTLMTQHLKRGSSSLLSRLREETQKALTEQIREGRKLGEEASTKLLIPMVMMLAVVMVIIMLPAFTSMGV